MSAYSTSALEILRNPALTLKWYVVPLLLVVMYIYNKEISTKNWNVVLGGAALWGMDLFNEIWNSIVFHATGFAPVWGRRRALETRRCYFSSATTSRFRSCSP